MICPHCQNDIQSHAAFCSKCGKTLTDVSTANAYKPVTRLIFFFITLLTYIAILNFSGLVTDYLSVLVTDILFAIIVLIFFLSDYKAVSKLFKFRWKKMKIVLVIIITAPIGALLVSLFADFLNHNLLDKSEFIYYNQFKGSPVPYLLTIVSVAVIPAIFEEIAFRGIMFNELLKVTRVKPAIMVSTIMFTILHFSLLSAIWIFPIGLILGYLRAKYRSIFYGIIGHFIYNTCVVIIQIILF